jgi:hypothetical protein
MTKKGRPAYITAEQLREKGIIPENYKQELIEMGKEGKSQSHFIVYLNIARPSYYKLLEIDPEFKNIIAQAREYSKLWWFERARDGFENGTSKNINGQLWSLMVRNMFPDDYVDKKEVDVSTQGQPIKDNKIEIEIIKKVIDEDTSDNK